MTVDESVVTLPEKKCADRRRPAIDGAGANEHPMGHPAKANARTG